jgi:molybdate transport system substrate-binding protein
MMRTRHDRSPTSPILVGIIAIICGLPVPAAAEDAPMTKMSPPWETFEPGTGRRFTVPEVDNAPDLFGDVVNPDLVVFYGGNQYMVVPELIAAFRRKHPQHRRIFVETLPPGILADQIEQGAVIVGNLRIDLKPDVFIAGKSRIERMQGGKQLFSETRPINRNRLALMVRAGNPATVQSLADLGKADVRVAMPNPAWEGIGRQVEELYRKVGGDKLAEQVMNKKVQDGTTVLTDIHHRQTPMRLMRDQSDVGPVWVTEALYQRRVGHPVHLVTLPEDQARMGTTVAASFKDAPHAQAAKDFVAFLTGPEAQRIFTEHGFMPPE